MHTEATKKKMSMAHKGYTPSAESIAKTQQEKNRKRLAKIAAQADTRERKPLTKNDVRHTLRRLSDDQVRAIRASTETDKALSTQYSCTPTTISRIRRFLIYKDV